MYYYMCFENKCDRINLELIEKRQKYDESSSHN